MKIKRIETDWKNGTKGHFLKRYDDNGNFLNNGGESGASYDIHIWFNAPIVGLTLMAGGTIKLHEGRIKSEVVS